MIKAYSGFVLEYGTEQDIAKARDLMNEVLLEVPEVASLHVIRGDLFRRLGDLEVARQSYILATQVGTPVDVKAAQIRLKQMAILDAIGLVPLPPGEGALPEAPFAEEIEKVEGPSPGGS